MDLHAWTHGGYSSPMATGTAPGCSPQPWLGLLKATGTRDIFSQARNTVGPYRNSIFQPACPIFWKDQPIFVLGWGEAPEAVGGV